MPLASLGFFLQISAEIFKGFPLYAPVRSLAHTFSFFQPAQHHSVITTVTLDHHAIVTTCATQAT